MRVQVPPSPPLEGCAELDKAAGWKPVVTARPHAGPNPAPSANGRIAQSAEHGILNPGVAGSTPAASTNWQFVNDGTGHCMQNRATLVRLHSCYPFGIMIYMKPTWHYFLKVASGKHTESEKKANWLTDTFIVSPLTSLYRRQNKAYKAEQAAMAGQERAKAKATTVSHPYTTKKTAPDRTDALMQIAQGVSNSYQQGSLARPKFMSQGKVIAR